ncbi:hypothetical protein KH5H1_75560 [Corallococcus caeni]|nr:hypothetical protein KH5H1_75560 [Corallococcus sp. KH5-1]
MAFLGLKEQGSASGGWTLCPTARHCTTQATHRESPTSARDAPRDAEKCVPAASPCVRARRGGALRVRWARTEPRFDDLVGVGSPSCANTVRKALTQDVTVEFTTTPTKLIKLTGLE